MSATNLIRWSGVALALGGIAVGLFLLALLPIGGFAATTADGAGFYHLAHLLHIVGGSLAMVGLIGLYARQHERSGWLGLLGFLLALIGTAFFVGLGMFSTFLLPLIFVHAPDLVVPGAPLDANTLLIFPITFILFLVGYSLLGITIIRANDLPRLSGVLLILAALLFALPWPWPVQVAGALLYAIGLTWIGLSLWSEKMENQEDLNPNGARVLQSEA